MVGQASRLSLKFRRRLMVILFPSNLQLPGNTLAMASRYSAIKNGLLSMKSTPGSGLPDDFNISA